MLVLLGVLWTAVNYYPKLEIVNAYASRIACTCHFEGNRSLENIVENELSYFPISLSSLEINPEEQSVTSKVFGLQARRSYYHKGHGCNYNSSPNFHVKSASSSSTIVPFISPDKKHIETLDSVMSKYFLEHKMRSLLIIRNDTIEYEKYAEGLKRETPQLGWSMTKSLSSALIGIAIKDSLFDLETKSLFPEWQNDIRSSITIEHLLHMNSGLEWDENEKEISDVTNLLFREKDIGIKMKASKLEFDPDSYWEYSSGTSNLLLKILRDRLDESEYQIFAKTRLFDPLNMSSAFIEQDEAGNFIGSSFSYASLLDWAKFGRLYLHRGLNHNGERILDEDYIRFSLEAVDIKNPQYGAHWWLNKEQVKFKNISSDCFFASGYMGQYLYVLPDQNLIIACTGLTEKYDKNQFLKEIIEALNFR